MQQENYSLEKQLHIAGGPNQSSSNQQQQQQQHQMQQQQQQGPRTKSFDNPSASSTASSGVGTSISSINSTNPNLAGLNNANSINTSAPSTPNVVKKYYEQKYGSTTNMAGGPMSPMGNNMSPNSINTSMIDNNKMMPPRNGVPRNSMFNQQPAAANITTSSINMNIPGHPQQPNSFMNNNPNNPNNPLGAGLSSLTSQFTSGIANLKLTASTFQTNKLTSKFMNPFSS